LAAIPAECDKVVFPVSIYEAESRGQNFGQVRNAFIRIVNQSGGTEITRYDLSEDASSETAVGQGYAAGLKGIARDFGVNVG